MANPTLFDFVRAYDSYYGQDVDRFIRVWESYFAGEDFPCPESADGLHWVTAGSCDNCGDKNREEGY